MYVPTTRYGPYTRAQARTKACGRAFYNFAGARSGHAPGTFKRPGGQAGRACISVQKVNKKSQIFAKSQKLRLKKWVKLQILKNKKLANLYICFISIQEKFQRNRSV